MNNVRNVSWGWAAILLGGLSPHPAWPEAPAGPMDISVGFLGGFSLTTVTGTAIENGTPVPLRVAGVTRALGGACLEFGRGRFALEPELLFSGKGYRTRGTPGGPAVTVVNELNYVEAPVLLKVRLAPNGAVCPYLGAGPSVGFLWSAQSRNGTAASAVTADVKGALSSYDYAAVIASGIAWSIGLGTLSAEVRYALGLANISQEAGSTMKNNTLSLVAGLAL